ncbi:hypothetical protein [Microbulbifer rhizosphaerae]|uniref:Uncharacterized protein n=1 Tax=Microbulbifer rhizosphaerae TaxID=1562603 RepID=A0A7W4WCF2_9GAMM|nr:hypothetical protein [Microbulbifer rhizosphaerae]MBB3061695.1 hypothetical protein [Microbulbifer rhizosphaerae]
MDKSTALETLRLSPGAEPKAIVAAYTRLARRYPMHQFPERHGRLLQAKEILLNPAGVFHKILFDEEVSLDWYPPRQPQGTRQEPALAHSLAAILRPAILNAGSVPFASTASIDDMLGMIDPKVLAGLLESFGDDPY